jgi:hypothetical protein
MLRETDSIVAENVVAQLHQCVQSQQQQQQMDT